MDDVARLEYIKNIFIDADVSQNALNQIVHGKDSAYDTDELEGELAEIFEYEDNNMVIQEIIQKFRREFGEDVINFLDIVNTDDSKFLAQGTKRRDLNRLHDELDDQDLIVAVDEFYDAQRNRLAITKVFDIEHSEVSDTHQYMIDAFSDCVNIILRLDMEESERIDLVTGLFIVTDKNQNNFFSNEHDETLRTDEEFAKIRKMIKKYNNQKTDLATKNARLVWLYSKEFADDLDILIDEFGIID